MTAKTRMMMGFVLCIVLGFVLGVATSELAERRGDDELGSMDYARGDGIRQGCEWCGDRCDGFLRGWRKGEEAERAKDAVSYPPTRSLEKAPRYIDQTTHTFLGESSTASYPWGTSTRKATM